MRQLVPRGPGFELTSSLTNNVFHACVASYYWRKLSSAWRYFRERFTELAKASQALAESDLSKPFPELRQALVGVENAPALPGLASVFEQYALLVNLSLEPPAEWTWDNGILIIAQQVAEGDHAISRQIGVRHGHP